MFNTYSVTVVFQSQTYFAPYRTPPNLPLSGEAYTLLDFVKPGFPLIRGIKGVLWGTGSIAELKTFVNN